MFMCPTQLAEIFGNVCTPFGTLAIRWHPSKILRRSTQGNPSVGERGRGLNARGVAKYSDFALIEGYIFRNDERDEVCQCQCQSKIFSVAKIAKLWRRPRGRCVIKAQCQEKTGEKEMFSDVDGMQTEKKMLGCRMAMSSKRVMQRLEMY